MSLHTACLALALLVPGADKGKEGTYPRPELLMEPAELAKPAVAKNFIILDARPWKQYEAGHIPRAMWVDHDAWSKEFAERRDESEWTTKLARLGILSPGEDAEDVKVVVYDDNRSKEAARIWWILRYWGFKEARLLNGGWKGWSSAGYEVSERERLFLLPGRRGFHGLAARSKRLATKEEVLKALKETESQIVDARSMAEHCGTATTAKRNGTIPGSRHLEWSDLLDAKTQRFKSAGELRKLFRDASIDPDRPTVTYCQSGGRAAVMAFTLELMGAKDVRNYYRSWAEWGNAEDTPVVQPKQK
jgi:thiosulfate/3-mercaptopyruvate sulfurtransferase